MPQAVKPPWRNAIPLLNQTSEGISLLKHYSEPKLAVVPTTFQISRVIKHPHYKLTKGPKQTRAIGVHHVRDGSLYMGRGAENFIFEAAKNKCPP